MNEKIGRNDPCPCGSGKKYKACCALKKQPATLGGKLKFKAKVISGGGVAAPKQQPTATVPDYNTLMERSFGTAWKEGGETPPLPADPSQYLTDGGEENSTEK